MTPTQMSPSPQTLEHVLEHVTGDLVAQFADTATPEQVTHIVRTACAELDGNGGHHEYLACLVEHRARAILHQLARMDEFNAT